MSKAQSTATDEALNKDEFNEFYKLQNNNISLQKKARWYFKETIQILKTCSTSIKDLNEQWLQFDADSKSKLSEHENIWKFFYIAVSSMDNFTDTIDDTVENLKSAQKTIPKPEKNGTLEFKINQARADVDKVEKELKQFREQKQNCEKQIAKNQKRSPSNLFGCINPEERSNEFLQRQTSIDALIENKRKRHKKCVKDFNQRKNQLYDESKEEEITRCELLKQKSMEFLKSFGIKSDEYNQLSETYEAKNDFKKWERTISRQNSNKLSKSRSVEDKTPAIGEEQ